MGATTEFFSHVSRQCPDVCSARAGNFDFDLAIAQWLQAERVDPDRARVTRNFFSLARRAVQPHPVFLESREHRRHLLKRASEFFLQAAQLGSADVRHGPFQHDLSRAVLSVGFDAEHHYTAITFHAAEENIGTLGALVDADEEQAGSKRIQRAEMADFLGAQNLFDLVHDLSRRRTLRLIDQQNAVLCHHKKLRKTRRTDSKLSLRCLGAIAYDFNRSSMRRASSSVSS